MELNEMLQSLYEMKTEYRQRQREFRDSVKHLKDSIESMENVVREEVVKLGRTVTYGEIRAEYKPTVLIKIKRGNNGNENN